jgi:hypothetical protein
LGGTADPGAEERDEAEVAGVEAREGVEGRGGLGVGPGDFGEHGGVEVDEGLEGREQGPRRGVPRREGAEVADGVVDLALCRIAAE